MKDFAGKVAFVTGAASGIGLGVARTLMREGMSVALCDIRADKLKVAVAETAKLGQGRAIGIEADVTSKEQVEKAAQRVIDEFGKVHFVMNNAGVVFRGQRIEDITDEAWHWVFNTNVFGPLHGIQAFVPRMRAQGEGGHIVNTASMAGLYVGDRMTGAYSASKHAVVAISEALAKDLAGTGIGVSVLTPAAVATEGYSSSAELRGSIGGTNLYPDEPDDIRAGLKPDEVGRRVVEGVRAGLFYLTTHPDTRPWVQERYKRLMESYDYAAKHWAK
jgi:NAD(P)-dependent dehydrogenase (short-subunit alcohol dehydrogenase family)